MLADVAIVGAGPAGAWAGYSLARRGAKVLLFDPSHPREKPCGGGVTGRALDLVGEVLKPAHLPRTIIRSARFVDSSSGLSASVSLASSASDASPLVVASRQAFDSALLEAACAAGAELVPSRVTNVVVGNAAATGFQIQTAAGPRWAGRLIGADGATSLVRRRLAQAFRRDQLSIATGYFAHGVTSEEIVIELLSDPPGYIWSFPRPTHLAIGICAQADAGVTAGALRERAGEWIRAAALAPGASFEAYSWPIPSLSAADFDRSASSGPGWCLVGDAAGLVDPITREGIYFALLSGQWAADALASDSDAWGRNYEERVREEITRDLARAARYRAGFFRQEFRHLLMLGLRESAAIRQVMADLVAGRQAYAHLKSRLLQTLEVKLALKLARSYLSSRARTMCSMTAPARATPRGLSRSPVWYNRGAVHNRCRIDEESDHESNRTA